MGESGFENQSSDKELKEKKKLVDDLADYRNGIDVMFGVGEPLKIEEEKEVLRKAEEAGERLYGNKTGEPVILSNDIVKSAIARCRGENEMKIVLGIYKTENDEKTLGMVEPESERLKGDRLMARVALFGRREFSRLKFVPESK